MDCRGGGCHNGSLETRFRVRLHPTWETYFMIILYDKGLSLAGMRWIAGKGNVICYLGNQV